jgi:hypothetical protein
LSAYLATAHGLKIDGLSARRREEAGARRDQHMDWQELAAVSMAGDHGRIVAEVLWREEDVDNGTYEKLSF